MRKACLLATLLLLAPSTSYAKTLEELLVEKGVITKNEAARTAESSPAKVYYNEGTRIDFPDAGFTVQINTMLQARYTFSDRPEKAPQDASDYPSTYNGIRGTRPNTSSFDIARARIILQGTALYQEFAYKLEGDFVGTSFDNGVYYFRDQTDGRKEANLKDAYIVWQPCEEYASKIGQFRTFITRQGYGNDAKLQFADRSIATDYTALGWQQGTTQVVNLADGMVQVGAGFFNGISDGEGINRSGTDTDHTAQGMVRINPVGKMDVMEEGDVNYTEDLALSFGSAYSYSEGHQVVAGSIARQQDVELQQVSVDANLKYSGFSVHSEYFYQTGETQHSNDQDFSTNGGYIQAGFFIDPKTVEIAGRYSMIDCDNGAAPGLCAGKDKVNEAAATINYYFWKHSLKAQLGYAFVNEDYLDKSIGDKGDANTNRWIFQLSSYF